MHPTRALAQKKNLLLAFDAFGTLYRPITDVHKIYAGVASKHGIDCYGHAGPDKAVLVKDSFKRAFKEESKKNPNYGKATGLGAEKWWSNLIRNTLNPFLKSGQIIPQVVVDELLTRFSTKEGYHIYPDILPFFKMLENKSTQEAISWKWEKTVVGIITNSDDRVPSVLKSFGLNIGPRRVGNSAECTPQATLKEDISFVVLSYDVGYEKPDRKIFEAATKMLEETLSENVEGLVADEFEKLYVGDSQEKDYFGATGAGWNAVLVDRSDENSGLGERGDLISVPLDHKQQRVNVVKNIGALRFWTPPSNHED